MVTGRLRGGGRRPLGCRRLCALTVGEALGAHLYLMGALLAADVEDALAEVEDGLEDKRALADAGLTTEEDDAPGDETATEDTVQLTVEHVDAGLVVGTDLAQVEWAAAVSAASLLPLRPTGCLAATRISLKVFH